MGSDGAGRSATAGSGGAGDAPRGWDRLNDTATQRRQTAARLRAAAAPQVERVRDLISERAAELGPSAEELAVAAAAAESARRPPLADPDLAAAEGANRFLVTLVSWVQQRLPRFGAVAAFAAAVYGRFTRHRGSVLAGGLAFFGMLSLVPSILSLGAVAALLIDPEDLVERVSALLADHPEVQDAFSGLFAEWSSLSYTGVAAIGFAGLVGLVFSLYAASRFVYVGRQVLDIAFEVRPRPPSFLARGMSILITLASQLGLVVAMGVLSVLPRVLAAVGLESVYTNNVSIVRALIALPVAYLLLTAGLRFGTASRSVPWLNWGCAIGTLIVLLGTFGLGWYLSVSVTYSQIVAVLGGVIALELWLYVIGVAIVLSAEIEALRLGFLHGRPAQEPIPWSLDDADRG